MTIQLTTMMTELMVVVTKADRAIKAAMATKEGAAEGADVAGAIKAIGLVASHGPSPLPVIGIKAMSLLTCPRDSTSKCGRCRKADTLGQH
jgi:hypothetical protein